MRSGARRSGPIQFSRECYLRKNVAQQRALFRAAKEPSSYREISISTVSRRYDHSSGSTSLLL